MRSNSGEAFPAPPASNASKPDLRFADMTDRVTQAVVQLTTFIDGGFSFPIWLEWQIDTHDSRGEAAIGMCDHL